MSEASPVPQHHNRNRHGDHHDLDHQQQQQHNIDSNNSSNRNRDKHSNTTTSTSKDVLRSPLIQRCLDVVMAESQRVACLVGKRVVVIRVSVGHDKGADLAHGSLP